MSDDLTRREALKSVAALTAATALAPLGALAADAAAVPLPAEMCGTMWLDMVNHRGLGGTGPLDVPEFLRRPSREEEAP